MDNIYGKRLPSDELPVVTGDGFMVVENASGQLYRIDSSGAKRLIDTDTAFPINKCHVIQYEGDAEPAERFGGSWEEDPEYAGRTTIGAGNGYDFGATGGSPDAVVVDHQHPDILTGYNGYVAVPASGSETKPGSFGITGSLGTNPAYGGNGFVTASPANAVSGTGKNMMPYKVNKIWKRVA